MNSIADESHPPKKTQLAHTIVALTLVSSLFTTVVLDGGWSGFGLFLRSSIIVLAFVYVAAIARRQLNLEVVIYLTAIVVLSFFQVLRLSSVLNAIDSMAIVHLTLLAMYRASTTHKFELGDYLVSPWFMPFRVPGCFNRLFDKPKTKPSKITQKQKQTINGVLITLPLLVIFTALFASADAVFGDAVQSIADTFAIDISINGKLLAQIIFGGVLFLFAASIFSKIFLHTPTDEGEKGSEASSKIDRSVELKIVLGSLNALFLVFIAIQAVYLFGGADNVISGDLTYAEYGRRGFFELLAVASIVFILAYNIQSYLLRAANKLPQMMLYALIAQVGIVMISAVRRLSLYEDVFGFTELRFYSHSFIFFLVVTFGLLVYNLWSRQPQSTLLSRLAMATVLYIVTLNIINPDVFIARQNLERYRETGKLDTDYLVYDLSQDAIDVKLQAIKESDDAETTEDMTRALCIWRDGGYFVPFQDDRTGQYLHPDDGWRAWNYQAATAGDRIDAKLECADPDDNPIN